MGFHNEELGFVFNIVSSLLYQLEVLETANNVPHSWGFLNF